MGTLEILVQNPCPFTAGDTRAQSSNTQPVEPSLQCRVLQLGLLVPCKAQLTQHQTRKALPFGNKAHSPQEELNPFPEVSQRSRPEGPGRAAHLGSGPPPRAAPCRCCRGCSSASWWGDTARGAAPPPSRSAGPRLLQGHAAPGDKPWELPRAQGTSPARSHHSHRQSPSCPPQLPTHGRGSTRSLPSMSCSEGTFVWLFAMLLRGPPWGAPGPPRHRQEKQLSRVLLAPPPHLRLWAAAAPSDPGV